MLNTPELMRCMNTQSGVTAFVAADASVRPPQRIVLLIIQESILKIRDSQEHDDYFVERVDVWLQDYVSIAQ